MIHVIATSQLKPGCLEDYLRILHANVPKVLAEDGCRQYAPCVDLEGGPRPAEQDTVTILETWDSLAQLQAHFQAPHMKAFVEAVRDLRLASSARVVRPL